MGLFAKLSGALSSTLSGRGHISAKRVTGVWLVILVSFCVVWIMMHEGGTSVVESLLETSLIIAASLLGLSSVTGIFKCRKDKDSDQNSQSD